mgnify:CR=1 FL=1
MAKKILVIDDSALMRRVISDIIKSGNEYEVAAIAKDGLEGYEYIRQNPTLYSAVILDINMPKMNGLQLLQKLQREHIEQTVMLSVRWRKRAHGKQFRHWNTGHSISLQNRKIIWKRKAKALENVFMRCLMLRPALKRHLKESVLLPYPEPYRQEAAGLHREKRRMKLQENSAAWRAQKL